MLWKFRLNQGNRSGTAAWMRSVVLASYQGERFIGEQIDSILAQLGPDDELVVSDDSSTDGTVQVAAQSRDPRVRILTNSIRVGYVENFQRAIRESRGDRIFFSDQDDVWLPNKVASLDLALRTKACVASDAIVVDERLHELQGSYFGHRAVRTFSPISILLRPCIIGATIACRRDYLAKLLPIPKGVPHDFWLTVNAAWDTELGVVESPLILYRRHAAAVSPTASRRKRPLRVIFVERTRIVSAFAGRRAGSIFGFK
jgi:glycosyltransferase involved in cell wall biosynthesis